MKYKTEKKISQFDPIVLKNMILFAMKSKKIYEINNEQLTYEKELTVYEFLAYFFLDEIKKVIFTKPYKEYNELNEDLIYIKGKINVKKIDKLILYNKVNCLYSELNLNNKLNQIIKYVLYYLINDEIISQNNKLRKKLINIYYYFEAVKLVDISIKDVLSIKLNCQNKNYESLLLICKYLIGSLKTNLSTKEKYMDVDSQLWWIYQEFIRNYYDLNKEKLNIQSVSSSNYNWNLIPIGDSNLEYVPRMRTDIEVEMEDQYIIMDAKCYESSITEFFGKKIFKSSNLYQIKSYLDVYRLNDKVKKLRGILIYPENDDISLNSGNHIFKDIENNYYVEIVNIDFHRDWNTVCDQLDNILNIEKKEF